MSKAETLVKILQREKSGVFSLRKGGAHKFEVYDRDSGDDENDGEVEPYGGAKCGQRGFGDGGAVRESDRLERGADCVRRDADGRGRSGAASTGGHGEPGEPLLQYSAFVRHLTDKKLVEVERGVVFARR